jgi:hypothetical protein
MPTSKAQLDSVKRRNAKLKAAGYMTVGTQIEPGTKAALEYLRQNLPGGFNLADAIKELILAKAEKHGFKPEQTK